MEKDFFEDLDKSIAGLVQTALLGQDVEEVARKLKKSESLVYQFTYPNRPQKPSLRQFMELLRGSPEKQRVIKEICRAFNMVALRRGPAEKMLKELVGELVE